MCYYTTLTNSGLHTYSKSLLPKPKDLRAFQAVSSSLKQLPQSLEEDIGAPDADASTASSSALVEDVFPKNAEVFSGFYMNLKVFWVISWEQHAKWKY